MLVSVIIPVYNTEKYLRNCIESVISQTYKNLEIILVDDGSPDNCGKICDEYAKTDLRIKVFHNENGGLSRARNFGIEKSNGEYVTFIDSDDFVEPNFVSTLVELCKKHNADIVQCNRCYNNEKKDRESECERIYSNIEAQYLLLGENYIPTVNSTCKLINKKLFDTLKFEEGRIHEDEIIIHRMLYLSNKVVFINKRMYVVNRSEGSITRSEYSLKKLDYLYALEDRIQFYTNVKLKELYTLTLYNYIMSVKKNIKQIQKKFPEEKIIIKQLKRKLIKAIVKALYSTDLTFRNKLALILRVCGLIR